MFYFSYSDFGGILGRITNAYGFKFGDSGLFMCYNAVTLELNYQNTPDKLYLSDEPKKICAYLGLDYEEWLRGFDTIDRIYDFIMKCVLFDKNIFKTLNVEHRKRLKHRPMYTNFLTYIGISNEEISFADETHGEVIQNKQSEVVEYFGKWNEVEKTKNIRLKEKERSDKYNGNIFVGRGYTGKNIGIIKKKFTEYINTKINLDMDKFIDLHTIEEITEIIEKFLSLQ